MIAPRLNAPPATGPGSTARQRALAVSLALHAGGITGALSLGGTAVITAAWSAHHAPSHPLELAVPSPNVAVAVDCPLPPVLEEPAPATSLDDAHLTWSPPLQLVDGEQPTTAVPELARRLQPDPEWLQRIRREPPAPAEPTTSTSPTSTDAGAQVPPSPLPGANAPPAYPLAAWRRGIEGRVVVVLEIDAQGHVRAAHVEISSGSSLLDDAALRALATWRFQPAERLGHPARSTHRQEVVFRLDRGPAAR